MAAVGIRILLLDLEFCQAVSVSTSQLDLIHAQDVVLVTTLCKALLCAVRALLAQDSR